MNYRITVRSEAEAMAAIERLDSIMRSNQAQLFRDIGAAWKRALPDYWQRTKTERTKLRTKTQVLRDEALSGDGGENYYGRHAHGEGVGVSTAWRWTNSLRGALAQYQEHGQDSISFDAVKSYRGPLDDPESIYHEAERSSGIPVFIAEYFADSITPAPMEVWLENSLLELVRRAPR